MQPCPIPLAPENHEPEAHHRYQQHIQDAEEDGAPCNTDGTATVAKSERNGVQQPQQIGPASQDHVVATNIQPSGGLPALVEGAHGENDVGKRAEGEETPPVAGWSVGGGEVGKDPEPGDGDVGEDGGPRDAREQAEREGDGREGDDPVDVPDVEHLVRRAGTVSNGAPA